MTLPTNRQPVSLLLGNMFLISLPLKRQHPTETFCGAPFARQVFNWYMAICCLLMRSGNLSCINNETSMESCTG